MNHQFGELAKGLARSVTRRQPRRLSGFGVGLAGMALASFGLTLPAAAQVSQLGPLVELSQPNPLAGCDDGVRPGTMTLNDAAEPFIAVNPVHPNNIVAAWIGGSDQNIIVGVSFDGGASWQQIPLPLTVCSSSQPYLGAVDPWLSFAPNGDLYAIALPAFTFTSKLIGVLKSSDGGLSWSVPTILDSPPSNPDKPIIFADPTDPHFVYAMWDQQPVKNRSGIAFARSTDGGNTWEAARPIVQTSPGSFAYNLQFGMHPDGTLLAFYQYYVEQPNKAPTLATLQVLRSSDKGQTWSAAGSPLRTTPIFTQNGASLVVDPDTGQLVRDLFFPSVTVDSASGNIYAAWDDGRFSNFQYSDVAFSMSADGGVTWSTPICINQTPPNIPPLNRQAFLPTLAVAPNGTIGLTYYDFRFNDPSAGLPTDYWFVQCQPNQSPTNPANWGNELRLTTTSFNMEAAANFGGFFLGDYFGLAAAGGGGFVAVFGAVDQNNHTSIFARRIGQ